MIVVSVGYLLLQTGLMMLSAYGILRKEVGEVYAYLRKIVNFQLLLNVKVLSGPFFGLAIKVFNCNSQELCKSPVHPVFTVLAAILMLSLVSQCLIVGLIYFIRNPLSGSYLALPTHTYILSKSLLKLLFPLYFSVDVKLSLSIVFLFVMTGLWGAYLFWHRLCAIPSFCRVHSYF